MTYTIQSARYANPARTAAILSTAERGDVAVTIVDNPALWQEMLDAVPQPAPFVIDLRAYAAGHRRRLEDSRITVALGGRPVALWTDQATRQALTGLMLALQDQPQLRVSWKSADGAFVDLDASGVRTIANALLAYVQGLFAKEAAALAGISAGAIVEAAQIDAIFA